MDNYQKEQLVVIQKRIAEIFENSQCCRSIDIHIHTDSLSFPEIKYEVNEYIPDESYMVEE